MPRKQRKVENKRIVIQRIAVILSILGIAILFFTYKNFLFAYLRYYFQPKTHPTEIEIVSNSDQISKEIKSDTKVVFVDEKFGLYIPKIKANSTVIPNVDPYNEKEYLAALERGVAHAKGSSTPNTKGNVFLFAHSAVNFYEQRKYNVYFYLLSKLEKGDDIYVSYQGQLYKYKVTNVKIVAPTEVGYLNDYKGRDTVTLMTCWPAGFNVKRVMVVADKVK